ncbi:MAG: hypothetical protein J6Y20_04040 [Lachnospiraceae bacterium]|nr:hypothetical protein [Lachnospiraceae bacterium]
MTDLEFADCLDAIRRRDQNGLMRIYNEYSAYLFQVVSALVSQREDAEDVTSDLFLKFWESPPAYRPGKGHTGYLEPWRATGPSITCGRTAAQSPSTRQRRPTSARYPRLPTRSSMRLPWNRFLP